jgi:hypothetical protein
MEAVTEVHENGRPGGQPFLFIFFFWRSLSAFARIVADLLSDI